MTIDSMMAANVNFRLKDTPGGDNVSGPGVLLSINGTDRTRLPIAGRNRAGHPRRYPGSPAAPAGPSLRAT